MGMQVRSPERESRWVNAVATSPVTSACRVPPAPVRENNSWVSMNAKASRTAAWWASSIRAAVAGSAIAHSVETDLTGENVRS